jgi:N-acetylglutamate synthase-like GNAT family acetyltransferase
LEIDYLANHRAFIPDIAALSYAEWTALFQAAEISQCGLEAMLAERAVTDRLPITLVALRDGELIGTGSIKLTEPGTKPGLSPWLAGILVKEAYRGSGAGAAIVRALEDKAAQLGIPTLYLSVGTAQGFYERLGWTVLERVDSYGVKEVALMHKHPVRALSGQA